MGLYLFTFTTLPCERCLAVLARNMVPYLLVYTKSTVVCNKCLQGVVNVGAVDMTEHQSVGGPYGIRGFPTIKVFGANKQKAVDYEGCQLLCVFWCCVVWIISLDNFHFYWHFVSKSAQFRFLVVKLFSDSDTVKEKWLQPNLRIIQQSC